MKYLTALFIIVIFVVTGCFGYAYFKERSAPLEESTLTQEVVNNEDLNVQVVETKIKSNISCRSNGSMDDVYPSGKYQFVQDYMRDTAWNCIGGSFGGESLSCSGKEVPTSRVHARIGDVINVCRVMNVGSISQPNWNLDVGPGIPPVPISYVKKVPDATPVTN